MDNRKILKLTEKVIEETEKFPEYTAVERIAALKSAAVLMEQTLQAESMIHILEKTFSKL